MKNKLKIAIGSDLHLEGRHLDLPVGVEADLLLLAGDILSIRGLLQWDAPYYRKFFEECIIRFKRVLMVCGNHEFYKSDINAIKDLREALEQMDLSDKVTVLEDSYVDIRGIRFIGSTLWTDLNNKDPLAVETVNQCLNDFRLIQNGLDEHYDYKNFRAGDSADIHFKSLKTIQKHIWDSKLPVVVMTHHGPSFNSVHPRYQYEWPLNYAFNSDLDDFILSNPEIKIWVHGHVHDPFLYKIGTTQVICNPRGYARENPEPYNFVYVTIDKNGNII